MSNKPKDNFIFQNAITTTGNGSVHTVNDSESVKIYFTISNGGTFTAYFEDSQDNVHWFPIQSYNNTSSAVGISATDATAAYTIALDGSNYFRVRISALSGTLSCVGRVNY
jgi:hypothetical protein